jgi:hypothetical protein
MKPCLVFLCPLLIASSVAAEHWPLDSADGALVVHGKADTAEGASGKSLLLDGSSLIELRDSARLNGGNSGFTFSVWLNPHELHGGQQLIAGKNRYSLNQRQWGLMIEPDGTLQAYLHQDGWSTITCKERLQEGRWHLVTLSVGQGEAILYLNGKRAGSVALKKPIPGTETDITIGGTRDGDRLRQMLRGAVDEARYEARVMSTEEIAAAYQPVVATHAVVKPLVSDTPLWDATVKLPEAIELPMLEGVEFSVIKKHEPEVDGYQWLHGVGLAWHKGRLYVSFGHNKGAENTPTEEARGRVSTDGGKTWGEIFTIDTGTEAPDLAISHGVFISQHERLWAFHGAFYERMGRIHTRAYLLDEATGRWEPKGVVVEDGFWALNLPLRMSDGNWIMPGIKARRYSTTEAHPAAVAISRGDDLMKWDLVAIAPSSGMRLWGESGVILDGANVTSVARYGPKPLALMATSTDRGRTWTTMAESNLPMATSKPCTGVLSSGQRFLICTTAANNGGRRAPLTIAVSKPGMKGFSKVFCIRHAIFPEGPGESNERAGLAYPCAIEREGKLYVGYSNSGGRRGNQNSAELAVIPVASLNAE